MPQGAEETIEMAAVTPDTGNRTSSEAPGPQPDELSYLDRIKRAAGEEMYEKYWGQFIQPQPCEVSVITDQGVDGGLFNEYGIPGNYQRTIARLRLLKMQKMQNKNCALIMGPVNQELLNGLGPAIDLDPLFLAAHLGRSYLPSDEADEFMQQYPSARDDWATMSYHMRGALLVDGSWRTARIRKQARISCCRLWQHGWIFLVSDLSFQDGGQKSPFSCELLLHSLGMIPLSLPYSPHRRNSFQLHRLVRTTLTQDRNIKSAGQAVREDFRSTLFRGPPEDSNLRVWRTSKRAVFTMMVMASAWRLNIDHLEQRLWALQPGAISDPTMRTFLPLTTLRLNLADLRSALMGARTSIKSEDEAHLRTLTDGSPSGRIDDVFAELLQRVDGLADVLGKEIQLVIGSVQVRDSDNMKHQTDRTLLLTVLAAVYLPLTLVTGVFGMNIQQINGSTPQYWTCLVAIVVAYIVTGILFMVGYFVRKKQRGSENKKATASARDNYKMA